MGAENKIYLSNIIRMHIDYDTYVFLFHQSYSFPLNGSIVAEF